MLVNFMNSLDKYLLGTYCTLGCCSECWVESGEQNRQEPSAHGASLIQVGKTDNNQFFKVKYAKY